ncbi:MAG: PH domain-containing protein [Candidatus Binataceae bacterium]
MEYVENNLGRDEVVRYRGKLSWSIFLWASIFLLFSLMTFVQGGWGAGIIWLILAAYPLIRFQTTELAVTNKRVIAKFGVIRCHTIEQRLEMVDNIGVEQGILQRLFKAGSVRITGSGASQTPIKGIADPLRFRREVNEAIDALKMRSINSAAS